jgi:hypothetical protein
VETQELRSSRRPTYCGGEPLRLVNWENSSKETE